MAINDFTPLSKGGCNHRYFDGSCDECREMRRDLVVPWTALENRVAAAEAAARVVSEADRDVGAQAQTRARLKARIAGNVAAGYAAVPGPELGNDWHGLAMPGEIAPLALEAAELILNGCGL